MNETPRNPDEFPSQGSDTTPQEHLGQQGATEHSERPAQAPADAAPQEPSAPERPAAPQQPAHSDAPAQQPAPSAPAPHTPAQSAATPPPVAPSAPAQPAAGPASHPSPDEARLDAQPRMEADPGYTDPAVQSAPRFDGSSFRAPAGEEKSGRRNLALGIVAAAAVAAIVGGVSGAGIALWATNGSNGGSVSAASPATINVNDTQNATAITAVAAKASPSVVTISATSSAGQGTGSGIAIDDEGHILTNAHVVTLDGAAGDAQISVTTSDGRLLDATVVGTDPLVDLAVIQIEDPSAVPAIDFADSSQLNVGDQTVAIGAPLGLSGTVTDGIVSALNRSITVASSAVPDDGAEDEMPEEQAPEYPWFFPGPQQEEEQQAPTTASSTVSLSVIQTDAAINPGNSGGALLDTDGDLIGVNVAIATTGGETSGNIGVGFAIPANVAQRVAQEIIETGTATHGLLGASVLDVTQDENQADATTVGASIAEVVAGGAAEAAGLRAGDIVIGVDGLPITSAGDLTAQILALPAGGETTITYVRNGESAETTATLGARE